MSEVDGLVSPLPESTRTGVCGVFVPRLAAVDEREFLLLQRVFDLLLDNAVVVSAN